MLNMQLTTRCGEVVGSAVKCSLWYSRTAPEVAQGDETGRVEAGRGLKTRLRSAVEVRRVEMGRGDTAMLDLRFRSHRGVR